MKKSELYIKTNTFFFNKMKVLTSDRIYCVLKVIPIYTDAYQIHIDTLHGKLCLKNE